MSMFFYPFFFLLLGWDVKSKVLLRVAIHGLKVEAVCDMLHENVHRAFLGQKPNEGRQIRRPSLFLAL